MTKPLLIIAAAGWLAAIVAGWMLLNAHEKVGKLEQANAALELKLKEIPNAAKERATIDRDIRSRPDSELFDRMR